MNKQTGTLLFAYQTIADMEVKMIEQADKLYSTEKKLFESERESNKAVLRAVEMLVTKDNELAELEANQAKRDLEMQAKGIDDALELCQASCLDTKIYVGDLLEVESRLREQAGDL